MFWLGQYNDDLKLESKMYSVLFLQMNSREKIKNHFVKMDFFQENTRLMFEMAKNDLLYKFTIHIENIILF